MDISRGFSALVGETIVSVDSTCINDITLTMKSGKVFHVNGDEQHYQIAVLVCTPEEPEQQQIYS